MHRTAPLSDFFCVNPIISKLRIFGGTTDAQREKILQRLELWEMDEGEFVFHKGDEPRHIYIVKGGKIDLQISGEHVQIHKHEIGVGECFGEASLMSMHLHTSTAIAAVPTELMVLSRSALIYLRHEDVDLFALLMMNLARELARRLYITDKMLLDLKAKGAETAEAGRGSHWS